MAFPHQRPLSRATGSRATGSRAIGSGGLQRRLWQQRPAWTGLAGLTPLLTTLPGATQRRRRLLAILLAALVLLLRPWPPFQWLPGWCVGGLLLWVLIELVLWLWWPRRSA